MWENDSNESIFLKKVKVNAVNERCSASVWVVMTHFETMRVPSQNRTISVA